MLFWLIKENKFKEKFSEKLFRLTEKILAVLIVWEVNEC
jgi:G:T-mismatch repair DNA endonuclease (very short patch repair protein)